MSARGAMHHEEIKEIMSSNIWTINHRGSNIRYNKITDAVVSIKMTNQLQGSGPESSKDG